jgi:membrane protein implicated in regulation of membrane protease activity
MDFEASTWWWILAGVAVIAELLTGTFYLLMLALGLSAGALAAHAGAGMAGQLVAAALVGGGAVAGWRWRRGKAAALSSRGRADLNQLDVGERVTVEQWQADRTARVHYRGATWTARYAGSDMPEPGVFVIKAVEGTRLLIDR